MDQNKTSDIKGKVCVTGAAGFVGSWIVKRLLELGYHVAGIKPKTVGAIYWNLPTIRSPIMGDYKKIGHLWELEGAKERLHLSKADLNEEGSFDDAIMGCEGVFHLASVVLIPKSDPKAEVLDPAVRGTLNVLQSCKKNPFLKKVVLTSSISAVARPSVYPKEPLDETSWSCAELCEKLKAWYPLSKVLAEQAAWKFAKENNINLVTVIPSFIIGSSLPYNLHTTASNVLSLLKGENETFAWHGRMGYVHIDDVASCHIKVYEDDTAEGRYLCTSTVLEGPELAAFLAKRYPWLPISLSFNDYVQKHPFEYNTSKVQKLGIKFKGIEEMFDDCIQSLKEQGHLP
ncbi:tetraketide alpha-pyrone reductase 1-like [Asparagus officinalis]|uniref:tetraketide alpha-pyrone reductase 1-like n=1 Tax=Asparagus officinalis TaxID=4686 RepID=UPI00098DEF7E|nr:tetraketide alpha-pyrone reductase 1-like [Asparagus officinalis]